MKMEKKREIQGETKENQETHEKEFKNENIKKSRGG